MAADQPDAAYRPGHPARPDFGDDARGDFDRLADGARLLAGLHEGRAGVSALLCLPVVVHDEHDGAGGGYQHLPDVPLLGTGGRKLLPAHRFLLHEEGGRRGLEEGVYRDALRRPGVPRRHPLLRVLCRDVLLHARRAAAGCRRCDDPAGAGADVHRRRGQERHVPAAYLAARRHGGPDARVGADPCRDDGRGGRLPRGAHVPALCRLCARGAALDGLYRGLYGAVRRRRGLRAERHQACAGVQYHFADRLHDRGAGRLHLG